jgi:cyclase
MAFSRTSDCRLRGVALGLAAVASGLLGIHASAQVQTGKNKLEVLPVKGNVYLIAGAGPNITMQVGDQYVVLVDAGPSDRADEVRAAVRSVTSKPIGMLIDTSFDSERIGGNEGVSRGGYPGIGSGVLGPQARASIVGSLNLLNRMSAAGLPPVAQPSDTYDQERWRFEINGEAVILEHPASAHSDTDTVVFFRRSDVVSTGAIFDMTRYPVIDRQHGGSLAGILKVLNHLSHDVVVPDENEEGGTYVIPGRGHVVDRNDLANYRDMLTIIRDRILAQVKNGRTLDEVKASKPTYDYDGGYGADAGPWTTDMFVEAVYRELIGELK